MNRAILTVWVLVMVGWGLPAGAGEGNVTKVRGTSLTIDKGADDGLELGLEVTVVRPPEESIIHPLTGENLGAPEIELGSGRVSKVSSRAAAVQLADNPILSVRPGDVARYLTPEERMVQEQEMATETAEEAARERSEIRSETARLARNISSIQGSIRGLERAIRDLRRFDDDVVKPQFNAINRQINEMRDELTQLRETVSLLNAVPVDDIGEGEPGELSPAELEQLRAMVQEEIDSLQGRLNQAQSPRPDSLMPPVPETEPELEPMEDETPIYAQLWLWALIGAVGLAGVAFWLYTRMAGDGDEDEEEDDELIDEEDDDDELDVEVEDEEEDDIVVEETS